MATLEVAAGMDVWTYIDAPELLYRIECDDLFEKIVPVVALVHVSMQTKSIL